MLGIAKMTVTLGVRRLTGPGGGVGKMQYWRMRQRVAHAIEWVNEASSGRLSG